MRSTVIARCAGVLLGFLLPTSVWANIGPKWWGDPSAEPQGLKGVAITHEKLTIDLRPLADVQPVQVHAIYQLNNPGRVKKLDLLFITGVEVVSDFEVRLGDRLIESKRLPSEQSPDKLPWDWKPPEYLPGIDSEQTHPWNRFGLTEKTLLAFSIELPPGPSTLEAHYRARATGASENYPTVTWQFPYILAPAREWGNFGRLDVTVYLPEAWQSNSTPKLEREGGVLRGHFTSLPANCLSVAVRAPVGPELQRTIRVYAIVYGFVLLCGGILCWWGGRLLGWLLVNKTSYRSSLWAVPGAFLMAIAWPAAFLATLTYARMAIYDLLAGQENPYFYEHFIGPNLGTLCLMPFVFLTGFVLAVRGFWRSLRTDPARIP
jgi:hypothetical protein